MSANGPTFKVMINERNGSKHMAQWDITNGNSGFEAILRSNLRQTLGNHSSFICITSLPNGQPGLQLKSSLMGSNK